MSEKDRHPLNLTRYASVAYGVEPAKYGGLLKVKDVVAALEHILDEDDFIQARAETLLCALKD